MPRSFKVNLNDQASAELKQVAAALGISETEVLRKGLALIGLYSKIKDRRNASLMIKDGDTVKELIIT